MTVETGKSIREPAKDILIDPMRPDEATFTAAMAARAFAPTPMPMAAMGGPNDKTMRIMEKAMMAMMTRMPGDVYVARSNGTIVGAMRAVESPGCQPSTGMRLIKPLMMYITLGRMAKKVLHFRGEWGRRDPKEHHLHLDPLVVEPEMQGRRIGSQMLTRFCQIADEKGIGAYLETDRDANVRLYSRFGFKVIDTTEIFGVPNRFMWRDPRE
jgi:GNAT superfamily N-acetyltransferase